MDGDDDGDDLPAVDAPLQDRRRLVRERLLWLGLYLLLLAILGVVVFRGSPHRRSSAASLRSDSPGSNGATNDPFAADHPEQQQDYSGSKEKLVPKGKEDGRKRSSKKGHRMPTGSSKDYGKESKGKWNEFKELRSKKEGSRDRKWSPKGPEDNKSAPKELEDKQWAQKGSSGDTKRGPKGMKGRSGGEMPYKREHGKKQWKSKDSTDWSMIEPLDPESLSESEPNGGD